MIRGGRTDHGHAQACRHTKLCEIFLHPHSHPAKNWSQYCRFAV
jgi:hypothetical protein